MKLDINAEMNYRTCNRFLEYVLYVAQYVSPDVPIHYLPY